MATAATSLRIEVTWQKMKFKSRAIGRMSHHKSEFKGRRNLFILALLTPQQPKALLIAMPLLVQLCKTRITRSGSQESASPPSCSCTIHIHAFYPSSCRVGTAVAAPPSFRPGEPALCGSHPLVTAY